MPKVSRAQCPDRICLDKHSQARSLDLQALKRVSPAQLRAVGLEERFGKPGCSTEVVAETLSQACSRLPDMKHCAATTDNIHSGAAGR